VRHVKLVSYYLVFLTVLFSVHFWWRLISHCSPLKLLLLFLLLSIKIP
jgi:hypothetical protein